MEACGGQWSSRSLPQRWSWASVTCSEHLPVSSFCRWKRDTSGTFRWSTSSVLTPSQAPGSSALSRPLWGATAGTWRTPVAGWALTSPSSMTMKGTRSRMAPIWSPWTWRCKSQSWPLLSPKPGRLSAAPLLPSCCYCWYLWWLVSSPGSARNRGRSRPRGTSWRNTLWIPRWTCPRGAQTGWRRTWTDSTARYTMWTYSVTPRAPTCSEVLESRNWIWKSEFTTIYRMEQKFNAGDPRVFFFSKVIFIKRGENTGIFITLPIKKGIW